MPKNQKGFTIVELLIVIVVIGILAGITIVAFSGIQENARNTARLSYATQVERGLIILLMDRGGTIDDLAVYNANFYDRSACLGINLEDMDGNGTGDCVSLSGNRVQASESPALHAEYTKIASLPKGGYPAVVSTSGTTFTAPFYYDQQINGEMIPLLEFNLEGQDKDCRRSTLLQAYSTNIVTGQKNSGGTATHTICIVPLQI